MSASIKKTGLDFQAVLHETSRSGSAHATTKAMAKVFFLGLMAACIASNQAFAGESVAHTANPYRALATDTGAAISSVTPHRAKRAHFAKESASEGTRNMADWIVDSGDNHNLPFLIVDKENARVFVFDGAGQIKGAASALLGMARGDESVPGIGQRKLATIGPDERTTPAGRFVAALDRNLHGEEILWVDYDAAISLHRVITRNAKERRAERLTSDTIEDNRISYGCINVPVKFYERVVSPAFRKNNGIVYVLPETRSTHEIFGSYNVDDHARQRLTAVPAPGLLEGTLPSERTIRLR